VSFYWRAQSFDMFALKTFLRTIVILFLFLPAAIPTSYARPLTAQEIQRLKAAEGLLEGVDKKSWWETVDELEKTRYPRILLAMKEAEARTYTDIDRDYNIVDQAKKEWLYSMVCLNMAYLQFVGDEGKPGSTTELNRLIRQKLMKYLPADVLKEQGFHYSL
jgi:hypothetical protein